MSDAEAIELTIQFQQAMGMDLRRGGANVIVRYLTDFMHVRFGLEPPVDTSDIPEQGEEAFQQARMQRKRPLVINEPRSRRHAGELISDIEEATDEEAAANTLLQSRFTILAALREYASATPSNGEPGDADGYYPDNPAFVVQLIDQRNDHHNNHLWVRIYKSGEVLVPGHITVGKVVNRIPLLTKEAQLDAVAGIDVEARSERHHRMTLDARDKLQGIMSGLPMGTPHFHELTELLHKLDEMAGAPTLNEPPGHEPRPTAATIEDVFDRASPEERQQIIDNMAIPPDYRPPEELLADMQSNAEKGQHSISCAMLLENVGELLGNLESGRWEIISHVPEHTDQTAKFMRELAKAKSKLSVKNPAYAAIDKLAVEIGAARSRSADVAKDRP